MQKNKHITLYVSGSIAAYKSATLVRLLVKSGAEVRVVLTEAAKKFITPLTFEVLSKQSVITDAFDSQEDFVPHIELADWTDLAIVAPASADLIGKLANGLADDMASLTLLATTAPKIIAPAMNEHMLNNPATVRNIRQLHHDGALFVDSGYGFLAEGYSGQGRMAEPEQIFAAVDAGLGVVQQGLKNKKVLITAGGTRELIDPVRFIGNKSSGKMGYAIAQSAINAGAQVTLVTGKTNLQPPLGAKVIHVISTKEMADAVAENFEQSDALIMAAAVADFMPENYVDQKIKKQAEDDGLTLKLKKTVDIIKTIGGQKHAGQIVVGFAAETQNLLNNANKKLNDKRMDMLVANNVSNDKIGFNSDDNQVTFLLPGQEPEQTPIMTKHAIANMLVDKISHLFNE